MTEKQIKQKFKETYPDFMRGDEPLSPYFDIWEYAIEIVTSEMQEGLDKIKETCELSLECKQFVFDKKIKELQEQLGDVKKFKSDYHELCNLKDMRIADLERKLEQTEKDLADYQFNYPTIKELEKENVELKEKLKIEQNARGDWFGKAVTKDRRLTEAKELIKDLMGSENSCCEEEMFFEIRNKAEQFLNSEV